MRQLLGSLAAVGAHTLVDSSALRLKKLLPFIALFGSWYLRVCSCSWPSHFILFFCLCVFRVVVEGLFTCLVSRCGERLSHSVCHDQEKGDELMSHGWDVAKQFVGVACGT